MILFLWFEISLGWGDIWTALIVPSPALITPFPNNAFLNIPGVNVPNNIWKNPPFCSLISFLIILLIPFVSNPDYSSDLTISTIFSNSSFEVINAVVPDP